MSIHNIGCCGSRLDSNGIRSMSGRRNVGCPLHHLRRIQRWIPMLRSIRGNCDGKKENQGNYICKIEGDARCHVLGLQSLVERPAGIFTWVLLRRNQYIAFQGYCTYNTGALHYH